MALVSYVDPGGFRQTDEIHPAVLKEAPVFDGEHRVHHQLRNLVIGHQLPLGTLFRIEQRCDHLRLEFISCEIAGLTGNAFDFSALDADHGRFLAVIRVRTRFDLDSTLEHMVVTHLRWPIALIGVTGVTQLGRNLFSFDLLADLDGMRDGVDSGGIAEHRALEALVDHPAEGHGRNK